jgi:uncharacterized protein YndB with AHSA1/START domain
MNQFGKYIGGDAIRFERLLPGSIERVWSFLTTRENLATWLFPGDIELKVGGRVHLEEPNGFMTGKVTRCDPPRLLAYTWGAKGEMPESEVSWELEARGKETLLVLTHRRVAPGFRSQVGAGWHQILDTLEARLAGKEPQGGMAAFDRYLAHYSKEVGPPSAEGQKYIEQARAAERR